MIALHLRVLYASWWCTKSYVFECTYRKSRLIFSEPPASYQGRTEKALMFTMGRDLIDSIACAAPGRLSSEFEAGASSMGLLSPTKVGEVA